MRFGWTMWICCGIIGMAAADDGALHPADLADWNIVCDSAAIPPEQYAATEFQTLWQGMTGVTLPIVEQAPPDTGAIFIGPDAVRASGASVDTGALGEEGLSVAVDGNAVRLYGGRTRGTLYAVYEFFEEWCGVRFLTRDHVYYPEDLASVSISLMKRTHVPPFAFRWSYYGETNRFPEFAARLHVNTVNLDEKLGGRTGFRLVGHNVAYLVPPKVYGEAHPEYYALVDGHRKLDMHGGGPQLCMTNPDVLDIVVKAVLEEIEKNPDAKNINVAQMDNGAYCTCEHCAAIDAREESHAGATLAFVNAVAEQVEKTHPEVLIGTYAYQYTRKPPKTIHARHNVMIQLCSIECCDFHPIDDPACARNRDFCADTAGWKEKADNIFIWHYNTNFRGYLLPFPNLRAIGKSVDYFVNNNGRGVFMQAAGNGFSTELSDLRNYVMARCLWKPGRDSWAEAEAFCRMHYAEAAQPILDYLAYYHDLVAQEGLHPGCFPTEAELGIGPETARRIIAYFDQALALAKSDEVRARVEKASLCGYRAALSASTMHLAYANGICTPQLDGIEDGLLDRYAELCARYEVAMDGEQKTCDQYLQEMRALYAGVKAVCIENDFWRVVVLPESNAKIVEMTYKPTGRNVVEPARAIDRFRFEEWVRQGEGPTSTDVHAYTVTAQQPGSATLSVTAKDGALIERTISLPGQAVRFQTTMTAKDARTYDFNVHPEYDAGSGSDDPGVVGIYVKNPGWIHANQGWKEAQPTEEQSALIQQSVSGGAFAYYNRAQGFGVEQRFDPAQFEGMTLFWSPARREINLELMTRIKSLQPGQKESYAYEVHYLQAPPE